MIYILEKYAHYLITTREQLETEPYLLGDLMNYIRVKGHTHFKSIKVREETYSYISDQNFIGWSNFMETKMETYVMNLQENSTSQ